MKTISSETTFDKDLSRLADLESVLWRQAERVSARAKGHGLGGKTIVLKLKTADFRLRTRAHSAWKRPPSWPTASSAPPRSALKREADGTRFRLLGVGLSNLMPAPSADPASLIDRRREAGGGGTGHGQDPGQVRRRRRGNRTRLQEAAAPEIDFGLSTRLSCPSSKHA